MDQLIDVIEGNRVYIPCLYVLNKVDAITMEVEIWPSRYLIMCLFFVIGIADFGQNS